MFEAKIKGKNGVGISESVIRRRENSWKNERKKVER